MVVRGAMLGEIVLWITWDQSVNPWEDDNFKLLHWAFVPLHWAPLGLATSFIWCIHKPWGTHSHGLLLQARVVRVMGQMLPDKKTDTKTKARHDCDDYHIKSETNSRFLYNQLFDHIETKSKGWIIIQQVWFIFKPNMKIKLIYIENKDNNAYFRITNNVKVCCKFTAGNLL